MKAALALLRISLFGAAHGFGNPRSLITHRKTPYMYPKMMKFSTIIPCLKKIKKWYNSCETTHEFCWHQQFSPELTKFGYIKNDKSCTLIPNLWFFCLSYWVFEGRFNQRNCSFNDVNKMSTRALLNVTSKFLLMMAPIKPYLVINKITISRKIWQKWLTREVTLQVIIFPLTMLIILHNEIS